MTHPEVGYALEDLPQAETISTRLSATRKFAVEHDIRLSFHPDQFVVLSSPHAHVVENSVRELEYHAFLAELVGADVINIHGGGTYGDKPAALARFAEVFKRLPENVATRLSVENDDASYTVTDLLPMYGSGPPLIHDVHHHRCNPDGLDECEATDLAAATWRDREPYVQISSPKDGRAIPNPTRTKVILMRTTFPVLAGLVHDQDVDTSLRKGCIKIMQAMNGRP